MNLTTPPLALASSQSGSSSTAEIKRVSRDFESVFAKMMISSMRQATPESALFPGENTLYRDMYDQQLARSLSAGKGLGLAPVIQRQLEQGNPANAGSTARAAEPATFHLPDRIRAPAWLPLRRHEPLQHGQSTLHASANTHANVNANANLNAYRNAELTLRAAAISPIQGESVDLREAALPNEASLAVNDNPLLPAWLSHKRLADIGKTIDKPSDQPRTAEEFVTAIWPQAQRAAAELGVSPRILVAQAALETGWGRRGIKHDDGASTNNLFGIKAGSRWTGDQVTRATTEVTGGVAHREKAAFRAYDSISQSFDDYVRLLKDNRRYQNAVAAGTDHRRFASELAKAGYATDPQYAAKLVAIAEGPTMRRALGPQAGPLVAMR